MNEFIFREYDIRGIVENDFPQEVVFDLGRAFGTYVKNKNKNVVLVSGDIRITTPKLKEWFCNGLLSCGVNVIDAGIVPTPTNYFSMFHYDIDAAVQITGSHNPSNYNGFKLSFDKKAFYGEQIQELKNIIKNQLYYKSNDGTIVLKEIIEDYNNDIINKIKINKPLNVAMDCGNAAACLVAPEIYKRLGIKITELFCNVDGTFPNHHPDPTVDKNLESIVEIIKSGNYNFGVAFDGDADRVVVVDEKGRIIRSDILMAIFLPEIISKGDKIIYDVKCSKALEDEILRLNGHPIIWKTGHSLIKDKMRLENSKFGGEMSGHIFFADDFYGFDDAVYVSLRLAQLLSNSEQKLSSIVDKIPKYYSTPELRFECIDDNEKFIISNKAFEYFSNHYNCDTIDGVRINFDDGWGLVRASNTQPVIVCRFEAKTMIRMEEIKKQILDKLSEYGDIQIEF
tara:strand:+ start:590 stop:1951 length:1362 start_codon:yes stop_codon:yes gene_type:complete